MPENNGSKTKPRRWEEPYVPLVHPDLGVIGADRDRMREAFEEAEAILFRQGGAFLIGADRVRHDDGSFETVGIRFQYESYMPARKAQPGEFEPADFQPGGAFDPGLFERTEPEQESAVDDGGEVFEDDGPPVSATAGTAAELESN